MSDPHPEHGDLVPAAPPPTSLAVAENHGGFLFDPTAGHRDVWCNVDVKTAAGRNAIQRMRQKASMTGMDATGQLLPVRACMVMAVTLANEATGEVAEVPRVCLLLADGRTLAFCSGGAFDSLRWIVSLYGPGPWEPPLAVRVRQVETRQKRRTYELTVEEDEAPAPPAPRKGVARG